MSDQLPDGCVYLGQNHRGKVIHTYNGWAIQAMDTGIEGYVAWLVDADDLGVEAENLFADGASRPVLTGMLL